MNVLTTPVGGRITTISNWRRILEIVNLCVTYKYLHAGTQ